jgi:hypothetical protein
VADNESPDKESRLSPGQEKAIRKYVLRWVLPPAIVVTAVSALIGWLVHDVGQKEAELNVIKELTPPLARALGDAQTASDWADKAKLSVNELTQKTEATSQSADKAKLSVNEAAQTVEALGQKLNSLGNLQDSLKLQGELYNKVADNLSKDPNFRKQLLSTDLQVYEILSTIHLRFLNGGPPDKPDDYNLIQELDKAQKIITVRELSGRKIVAVSWSPTGNVGALKNFQETKFEPAGDNSVKISSSVVQGQAAAVEFTLVILHVPK